MVTNISLFLIDFISSRFWL